MLWPLCVITIPWQLMASAMGCRGHAMICEGMLRANKRHELSWEGTTDLDDDTVHTP